jgi:hypothetical protein
MSHWWYSTFSFFLVLGLWYWGARSFQLTWWQFMLGATVIAVLWPRRKAAR